MLTEACLKSMAGRYDGRETWHEWVDFWFYSGVKGSDIRVGYSTVTGDTYGWVNWKLDTDKHREKELPSGLRRALVALAISIDDGTYKGEMEFNRVR